MPIGEIRRGERGLAERHDATASSRDLLHMRLILHSYSAASQVRPRNVRPPDVRRQRLSVVANLDYVPQKLLKVAVGSIAQEHVDARLPARTAAP